METKTEKRMGERSDSHFSEIWGYPRATDLPMRIKKRGQFGNSSIALFWTGHCIFRRKDEVRHFMLVGISFFFFFGWQIVSVRVFSQGGVRWVSERSEGESGKSELTHCDVTSHNAARRQKAKKRKDNQKNEREAACIYSLKVQPMYH